MKVSKYTLGRRVTSPESDSDLFGAVSALAVVNGLIVCATSGKKFVIVEINSISMSMFVFNIVYLYILMEQVDIEDVIKPYGIINIDENTVYNFLDKYYLSNLDSSNIKNEFITYQTTIKTKIIKSDYVINCCASLKPVNARDLFINSEIPHLIQKSITNLKKKKSFRPVRH